MWRLWALLPRLSPATILSLISSQHQGWRPSITVTLLPLVSLVRPLGRLLIILIIRRLLVSTLSVLRLATVPPAAMLQPWAVLPINLLNSRPGRLSGTLY